VNRFLGYLLLLAGMALVGTYVALSRPLTAAFPVFLLAWLRFAIAAVAMAPWTMGRAGDPPLSRRQWGALFTQSFFGNFLFSICMLIAPKTLRQKDCRGLGSLERRRISPGNGGLAEGNRCPGSGRH